VLTIRSKKNITAEQIKDFSDVEEKDRAKNKDHICCVLPASLFEGATEEAAKKVQEEAKTALETKCKGFTIIAGNSATILQVGFVVGLTFLISALTL